MSIKWGVRRGGEKSLNVGLLSSEVDHFLFFYWPFVFFLHLEIGISGDLLFFSVGTFADVSITRPLLNSRSPVLSCMGGSSYNSAKDVLLHILALVPIPKFSPWWST